MSKAKILIATTVYISVGLAAIHFQAIRYADQMMVFLAKEPSPDLYANEHGFQYMAYWYTYGLGWLVLLSIIGFIFLIVYSKRKHENT